MVERLPEVPRGEPVSIRVDGEVLEAFVGETVASVLWASGRRQVRRSTVRGEPRGVFCGMGICFDCLIRHGNRTERACMLLVEDGMELVSFEAPS